MTHLCCPSCRLRFTPAGGEYVDACPECGRPTQPVTSAATLVGFPLFGPEDSPQSLPEAIALSMQIPKPGGSRS